MVCSPTHIPIVEFKAQLQVGLQGLDALAVGDREGGHRAHHYVDQDTVGG